ncbi:MAG TPA: aminotransferase class I/II-fold pyridoxal phosphate-dependent enzyme [Bryobacteraceae bacterium]|nr:aminotransferase class I/II-fold pyridoxal phosphate-dependent enzyme [Bryobacteraceae bacterium]
MLTRRELASRIGFGGVVAGMLTEMAYAQRAAVHTGTPLPKDMVWINANENPAGPPASSLKVMAEVMPTSGRYHYQEFDDFYAKLAHSEDLEPNQILVGAGSSESLHCAVDAFTSPTRPLITISPTYEAPPELAKALGRRVITVPVNDKYYADVHKLVAEAEKAGGGLIYLCNPNNPTSAVTPKGDIAWMMANLPSNTYVLIDEAYIHFAETPEMESGLNYVRQGKNMIVTRTFSKLYGMAGLRAGFACARPDLIQQMTPYRNNVISIVTAHGVMAAIANAKTIVPERRARLSRTRSELCAWLRQKNVKFIEPQANFLMIDVHRDVRDFAKDMAERGVAVGRPFPPLDHMLRVSIGTDQDMAKFRDVFSRVYQA